MNANLCKKRRVKNPRLTQNTCAFDTIFQLYAAAYMDSPKFKKYADKDTTSDFIELVKSFCDWGRMEEVQDGRETILYSIFEEKVKIRRRILELDCYMSVIDMFIGITEEKRCPSCVNYSCLKKTSLPLNCINLNIADFAKSIHFKPESKHCKKCQVNMNIEIQRIFSPVVIIDLDGMQEPKIPIAEIQKLMIINEESFRLSGLIEATGNHFIAHALRPDGCWHTYDGLRPTSTKTIPESTILHPVFLLYSSFDSHPLPNSNITSSISIDEIMQSKFPIIRLNKCKLVTSKASFTQ